MRTIVVDPQKTIECGICHSEDKWIHRIAIRGIHGLYCVKCDTLTVFEPIHSPMVLEGFKKEIDDIKLDVSAIL